MEFEINPTLVTGITAAIGAIVIASVLPKMIRGYIEERRERIEKERHDRAVNLLIAAIFRDN